MSYANTFMYSLDRPLLQYKDYVNVLTGDQLENFAKRHGKVMSFKPAKIWIASRTGVNQTVAPDEPALYISDASGNAYAFKYKFQNDILKLLDREGKNGLLKLINANKKLKPFNWRQIDVSILTGYIFKCFSKNTLSWDADTLKRYRGLIRAIDHQKIVGAFLPYYLAPEDNISGINKNYIASVLQKYNQFMVGGVILYTQDKLNSPVAFIPDVDFMYHIDLTSYRGLKLGEMQKSYLDAFQNPEFAATHKRCDAPKPNDIELYQKHQPKTKEQPKNINQKENNLRVGIVQPAKIAKDTESDTRDLYAKLTSVVDKFAKEEYSGFIVYNKEVIKAEDNVQIGIVCNKFSNMDAVQVKKCFIDNLSKNNAFSAKEAYKVNFTILASEDGDKVRFKTYLGLYGSNTENILLNDTLKDRNELNSYEETPSVFLPGILGESYDVLMDKDMLSSFDVQVGKGVEEGLKLINNALDLSIGVDSISVTKNEYKVNFTEYIEYLSIVDTGKGSLKYTLVYDASFIVVDDDREAEGDDYLVGYLSYSGDTGVALSIKALCKRFTDLL